MTIPTRAKRAAGLTTVNGLGIVVLSVWSRQTGHPDLLDYLFFALLLLTSGFVAVAGPQDVRATFRWMTATYAGSLFLLFGFHILLFGFHP